MTSASNHSQLNVSVGVECHPGSVRTENQDRISRASTPHGDLYIVADGVGGYQGGAEAAQAVVDGFARELTAHSRLPVAEALQTAAQTINRELERRGLAQDTPSKMGSTVVIAIIRGATAVIAHIGDSRAYLVRAGALQQITHDHSVIQRLIDEGALALADAREHPSASVLTQALGQSEEVEIAIATVELQAGDALLLCSDGLWGYLGEKEMEAIAVAPELSPSACAEALLHLALQGGGGDNISVQFLRFSAAAAPVQTRKLVWGVPASTAIPIAGGLIAALAVAGGLTAWNYRHGVLPPPPPFAVPAPVSAAPQSVATLRVVDDNGDRVSWAPRLRGLAYLKTEVVKAGADCRALERDRDTLYFKPAAAAAAEYVRLDLSIPARDEQQLPLDSVACGTGDLFALPPKQTSRAEVKKKTRRAAEPLGLNPIDLP